MERRLIDRPAVAAMLGITVEKFYRRYPELRANPVNPFPGPVLGNQSGARWNPDAIQRWINQGGEHAEASCHPAVAASADDDRETRKQARKNRAAQLAAAS